LNRDRTLLMAQRKGRVKPLGAPPAHLAETQLQAWCDIVNQCHDVLRNSSDRIIVELAATLLAHWRAGERSAVRLRMLYRILGKCLLPMAARRQLLFGYRH
jgi:hypothetical protein